MRRLFLLLLASCLLGAADAQSLLIPDTRSNLDELLQRSVVRVWWSQNLIGGGEEFRFAVNGALIQNVAPRLLASYETDAWVYDAAGHVVAYLGPAGSWFDRGIPQLLVQTTDGQSMTARLVGIDEAQGIAVVQTEPSALRPTPVQFKIQWKPRSEFYIASLDGGFNLSNCTVLNAEKQAGLEEYKLHFKKLRIGRPGNLVFTHEGQFAGFLTTVARRLSPMRTFFVNLLPVDQIIPSVQRIIRTRSNIKGGWLGVYLKDQPHQAQIVSAGEVTVTDVVPGGPADQAGIMENDRIVKVNDVTTEDLSQVVRMIQKSPAGSTVKMEIARGDKILQVRPKVANREAYEEQATYLIEVPPQEYNAIRVRRADESLMKRYDALFVGIYISDTLQPAKIQGLVVTDVVVNTPAARAGLRKGDVILQVNGMPVRSMDQYATALAALVNNSTPRAITLRCLRDNKEIQKTISLK